METDRYIVVNTNSERMNAYLVKQGLNYRQPPYLPMPVTPTITVIDTRFHEYFLTDTEGVLMLNRLATMKAESLFICNELRYRITGDHDTPGQFYRSLNKFKKPEYV